MALDLLHLEKHRVKAGVQGKMFLFYGGVKTGKTTVASKFNKSIILSYEPGFNLIDDVSAVMVNSWLELKNYIKQLKKPEVREMYETVIIDTVDLMWYSCEKFIKTQNDVEDLTDLAFGRGYRKVKDEFQDAITQLGQMGYTLIFISHSEKKDYIDAMGVSHSGITPTLDKRPKEIITGLVDVMAFIFQENDGNGNVSTAYLRGGKYGDTEVEAGSRYGEGLPIKIKFSYEELCKAIQSADEAMIASGIKISTDNKTILEQVKEEEKTVSKKSFSDVYQDMNKIVGKLKERIANGETELGDEITRIVESYFGAGKKISEATPNQLDILIEATKELEGLL